MKVARHLAWIFIGGMLAEVGAGCGPAPPSNLSPTSEQDAQRFERATRYTRELARHNREAERKALSRRKAVGSRR